MRIPLVNLLVKSPLPKTREQMTRVRKCVDKVPALIDALLEGDQASVDRLAKETSILEGEADTIKNELRAAMPIRLLLPVDRRDALRLITEIDALADCAEDVGVLLTLRPLDVPVEMRDVLVNYVESVMKTVDIAERLVSTMDALVRSGFRGKTGRTSLKLVDELSDGEHDADKIQDQCAKALFRAEDELKPVALFMWTKVLNKIGDIANHSEKIGDQFRLFIVQ